MIVRIANLNSFCAWMREAIKAKEQAMDDIERLTFAEFCELKNYAYPVKPEPKPTITSKDLLAKMSIKEKNEYLQLEAFASTFGTFIHPNGVIADARENLLYHKEVPNEVKGEGRDMVIYGYKQSVDPDLVDQLFLQLQNKYRDYERRLNAIKYSLKEEAENINASNARQYQNEFNAYSETVSNIRNEMTVYQAEKRNEIANLKIVIPEKLQDTYMYLNSLGGQQN